MSERPVDPKLKELLSLLLEIAVGDREKLPTTAADQMAERFIRKHRLVSLAPGQTVVGPEPGSNVWSRLRDRIMDCLSGDYERRSAKAEHIARTLMDAPEIVITEGQWPEIDKESDDE